MPLVTNGIALPLVFLNCGRYFLISVFKLASSGNDSSKPIFFCAIVAVNGSSKIKYENTSAISSGGFVTA